jgi:hypothetical protein
MGMGCIIAGMIFLFNPFISIVDILPDVIGYALIVFGMSKFADVELKIREARRRMTSALYVAAGRFAVMLGSFFMDFDATLTLVFTFSFAALEIFFVLPAFNMFFEGFGYSCMRFSEKSSIKKAEDLAKLTPIFLIVRSAAAFIPDLTSLKTDYGYVGDETGLEDSGVLRVVLLGFCFIVALVFGLVWLSAVMPYLGGMKKNTPYLEYIKEKYETTVLTDGALLMRRSVKRYTSLSFASLFFLTCISMDGYYLIPEFMCAALMLLAFFFAKRYVAGYKMTAALSAAATAVMLGAYSLIFRYSSEFGYVIYPARANGFWGYFLPYAVCAAVGYAMLICLYYRGRGALRAMIEDSVGVRGTSDARRKEIDEYRKKELCRYADRLFILQVAAAGGSLALMLAMPWFRLAWTARTIITVIAIVYAYNVYHDINEEAEKAL